MDAGNHLAEPERSFTGIASPKDSAQAAPSGGTADEFCNQVGYGFSTLSVGGNAQATVGLGRNVDIRYGLPTANRVARIRQPFGESPDQTFVVGLDSEDLSRTGGCTRTAFEATFTQAKLGLGFVNCQNGKGDPQEIQVDLQTRLAARRGT